MLNPLDPKWSPSQRAAMQSIIIILLGAIITGFSVVSDTLARGGTVDYNHLALIVGVTIAISFGHGLVTYLMAHNADMAIVVSAATQLVEKRFGSLVPPSVQQDVNTPTTQQDGQQRPLVSIHLADNPSSPPQNVIPNQPISNTNTIPGSVTITTQSLSKTSLIPLPSENGVDLPMSMTEIPLQRGIHGK